jgi:predicted small metal-binding protein
MVRAVCKDYGFDCNFIVEGNIEKVVQEFGEHTTKKHGIEYSEETLTKFMLNNKS